MRALKDLENLKANLDSINKDLKDPDISDAEKKDLKQKKKDIMKEQKFGKIGKMVGIAAESGPPKSTGGGKLKDGSRTKVRGVRIANKGYRKAKLS